MKALTNEDRNSAAWARLRTHLEERLLILREQNDADGTEVQTARRRGAIAEIKEILSLAAPPAPKVVAVRFE